MMSYLQSLPGSVLALYIISAGLFVSTVIPCLVRWKLDLHPNEYFGKGAFDAFKLITSMALLVFAFSLVRVQGDHRNAEDLVAKEAALALKMESALTAFGGPDATELRADLKKYIESVTVDEWPQMQKGQGSDKTGNLLTDLSQGIRLLTPANAVQQMARVEIGVTLNQLTDVRQARLAAAKVSLPGYLWQALVVSVMLLIILGWFQTPLARMIPYVGGVTIGFALLFVLLIQSGGIFVGENQVKSDDLLKTTKLGGF